MADAMKSQADNDFDDQVEAINLRAERKPAPSPYRKPSNLSVSTRMERGQKSPMSTKALMEAKRREVSAREGDMHGISPSPTSYVSPTKQQGGRGQKSKPPSFVLGGKRKPSTNEVHSVGILTQNTLHGTAKERIVSKFGINAALLQAREENGHALSARESPVAEAQTLPRTPEAPRAPRESSSFRRSGTGWTGDANVNTPGTSQTLLEGGIRPRTSQSMRSSSNMRAFSATPSRTTGAREVSGAAGDGGGWRSTASNRTPGGEMRRPSTSSTQYSEAQSEAIGSDRLPRVQEMHARRSGSVQSSRGGASAASSSGRPGSRNAQHVQQRPSSVMAGGVILCAEDITPHIKRAPQLVLLNRHLIDRTIPRMNCPSPTPSNTVSNGVSDWKRDEMLVSWRKDVQKRENKLKLKRLKQANIDVQWILGRRQQQLKELRERQKHEEAMTVASQMKQESDMSDSKGKEGSGHHLQVQLQSGLQQKTATGRTNQTRLGWQKPPDPAVYPGYTQSETKEVAVWVRPRVFITKKVQKSLRRSDVAWDVSNLVVDDANNN